MRGREGVLDVDARDHKRAIADYWNHLPCNYGFASAPEGSREFFEEIERKKLLLEDHIPHVAEFAGHRGEQVLEVGCGLGTMAIQYARHGARMTAVDLSSQSLALAKRRFALEGLPGQFHQGDGERLSFRDERFDFVVSWGVIHHTPNTAGVISEIYRVLRPGGAFLVMVYYKYSATYLWDILFKKGIIHGERLKRGAAELLNKHTEAQGNSPLTKVYSIRRVREMFSRFTEVRAQPYYLFKYKEGGYKEGRREPRFLYRHFPNTLYQLAGRIAGWHLVVKGRKPVGG